MLDNLQAHALHPRLEPLKIGQSEIVILSNFSMRPSPATSTQLMPTAVKSCKETEDNKLMIRSMFHCWLPTFPNTCLRSRASSYSPIRGRERAGA